MPGEWAKKAWDIRRGDAREGQKYMIVELPENARNVIGGKRKAGTGRDFMKGKILWTGGISS